MKYHQNICSDLSEFKNVCFKNDNTEKLNALRDVLFEIENNYRKQDEAENIKNLPEKNKARWKYLGS